MNANLRPNTILQARYKIIQLLGHGGMGAVYEAEQLDLGRMVAIKESFGVAPADREQFRLEAKILAGLRHINLPNVIEHFIEDRNERQYLVMEYIEGENLDQVVQTHGAQDESIVLKWMDQVLDAVQYLHNQKPYPIVHRDIKPGNIKLQPGGRIILVDFGIAKVLRASQRTMTGARAATDGFSSPEQYGSGTDTRSDIYSLGATLYFILTGRVPPSAVDRLVGRETLVLPSQLNICLSKTVERAMWRMMELEPNKRYQRIEDVRRALGAEVERDADAVSFSMPTFLSRKLPQLPSFLPLPSRPFSPTIPPNFPSLILSLGASKKPLRPPTKNLRLYLKQSLSQVTSSSFNKTRGYIASEILRLVLDTDPESEGTTILLRGYKGVGTSEILKQVMKATHRYGGKNHIVVRIDLSASSYQQIEMQFLRDLVGNMGMQLYAKASFDVRRSIRLIYDKYKVKYDQFKPKHKKIVTKTRIAPLTILEVIGSIRAALGLGISREIETTDELEPISPPDTQTLIGNMISDLCELASFIHKENGKLVIILNKVENLELLNQLDRLAKHSGTVIITVVDEQDYNQWLVQDAHTVRRFAQRPLYIGCLWSLPSDLCKALFYESVEVDSPEFRIFFRYMQYQGRGLPDRVVKPVLSSHIVPLTDLQSTLWRFMPLQEAFEVPISRLREWYKYAKLEAILQDSGWSTLFRDEDDPTCNVLDSFDEEKRDRIKQGIYTVLDYLVDRSQSGSKPNIDEIFQYAVANCNLPFTEETTREIIQELISCLEITGMAKQSDSGLDLSRLTQTT